MNKKKEIKASLRANILADTDKNLLWGLIPFLCEVLDCNHNDSGILSEAFVEDGPFDLLHSPGSWNSLIAQMKIAIVNLTNASYLATICEFREEMTCTMNSDKISSDLKGKLLLLFLNTPEEISFQIRKNVEISLRKYANCKIVYSFTKTMGFHYRVMQEVSVGNIHDHKPTCHNPPQGKYHCRMGYPNGLFKYTFAVEIEHNDKKKTPAYQKDWKYIPTHDENNPRHGIPVSCAPVLDDPSSNEFYKNPLQQTKERLICFETKRSKLRDLTPEEIKAIIAESYVRDKLNLKQIADSNRKRSIHEVKILKMIASWETRNGLVVPYNDCYIALVNGNQSMNFLGSSVASKLVTHYLTSYLSKDKVAPSAILPIISSAYRKCIRFPSKHPQAGHPERDTLYFIQKCTFLWGKQKEVSAQQAAAALIKNLSDFCTEKTQYAHIGSGISHILEAFPQQKLFYDDANRYQDSHQPFDARRNIYGVLSGHSYSLDGNAPEEAIAIENIPDVDPDANTTLGATAILDIGNQKKDVLLDHEMFDNRGHRLRYLNMIEYLDIMNPIKIQSKPMDDDASATIENRGHQPGNCQTFDGRYRLAALYTQQIAMVQRFPSTIPHSPCAIPPVPNVLTPEWKKVADEYAAFYLTAFSPWNTYTESHCALSYDNFIQFIRSLISSKCIIDRVILETIKSMSLSLNIDPKIKIAHQAFHHRNSTVWTEEERRQHFTDENAYETKFKDAKEMADIITFLTDMLSLNEKQGKNDILVTEYLDETRSNYSELMDGHDNSQLPALPSVFYSRQNKTKLHVTNNMNKNIFCKTKLKKVVDINIKMRSKDIPDVKVPTSDDLKEYEGIYQKSLAEVELNPQQQALLDKYHDFFRNQALTAPLDILHGAGGTGKTTIARLLQKLSKMYGDNVSTSIMGVACNQLGGGAVTIDSILLPRHHK